MSAQDKTEQVLRDIHILLSKSEVYNRSTDKVIIDKKAFLLLLNRLNVCIYEIMEEYELTQQSRDKAEREARKRGDDIIWDASRKAEDVYAASVLYTDEALRRAQDIMQEASDSVKEVFNKMNEELKKEKDTMHRDQSELKGYLQDLVDTGKYLKLIEDRNKEIRKEKNSEKKQIEKSSFTAVKPEIKINPEYFEKTGVSLEEEVPKETGETAIPEVNIHLDAEYFHWKEDEEEVKTEKKPSKQSLIGKILKGQ